MARSNAAFSTTGAAVSFIIAALVAISPISARENPPKANPDRIISVTPTTIVAVYSQTLQRKDHHTITGWIRIEHPARPRPHPRAHRTWTQYYGAFDCSRRRWRPLLSIRYDFRGREVGRRRYSSDERQTIDGHQAMVGLLRYVCQRSQPREHRHSDYEKYNM